MTTTNTQQHSQQEAQQLELFGRRRVAVSSVVVASNGSVASGSVASGSVTRTPASNVPMEHRWQPSRLAQPRHESPSQQGARGRVRIDRKVSDSLYTFRHSTPGQPVQRPVGQQRSHGFEVLDCVAGSVEWVGEPEPSDSVPAQLAGDAGPFKSAAHRSRVHRTRAPRSTPRHAAPKRVKRSMKAQRVQVQAVQTQPVAAKVSSRSTTTAVGLSSAGLSYVFVAVTLACTFLV